MTDNEKLFRQKVEKLTKVYVAKNKDYGDSFSQSLDKYGILASLIRMGDKMNRIDSLYDKPTTEVDESLVDSLEDLANYAIMTAIWLEKQVEDMGNHVRYWGDDFEDDYDECISHEEMKRELGLDDGWHEFDDDDFDDDDDVDDDIDTFLDMLSNFDSGEDTNEGTHIDYFNCGFDDECTHDDYFNFDSDDDESEDDSDDFSMDGLPKFRIVRRPRGTMGNKDFINYLDLIRYLYDEEGD